MLVGLMNTDVFEGSTFLDSYRAAKVILENRSGIEVRRDKTAPRPMATNVTAAPRVSRP